MRFFSSLSWFATSICFIVYLHGVGAQTSSIDTGATGSSLTTDIYDTPTCQSSTDCSVTAAGGQTTSAASATDQLTDSQPTPSLGDAPGFTPSSTSLSNLE